MYVFFMRMKYTRLPILACFHTDTLNWQVLRGKDKYFV